jgi:hypothetical protein
MRPKKHETTGSGDLFRARLDQIINMTRRGRLVPTPRGRSPSPSAQAARTSVAGPYAQTRGRNNVNT